MPICPVEMLQRIGTEIFDVVGSPHEESAWVAETLIRSNLMGHDSHGVVRLMQYVEQIRKGEIIPGASVEVEHDAPSMAVLNGNLGWGQVIARKAMLLAIEKAEQNTVGLVVAHHCPHIGRLGEYPVMAAERQMIGYTVINSHGGGISVAPWGGIDRRFTPNPLAFAAPSGTEWPILMDITTSTVPEGKVRVAWYDKQTLSPGLIIDAEGNPTTDPAAFYGPPPGALLPLGGSLGHKGYALTVMTEVLGGILSGAGFSGEDVPTKGNGLYFQAVNISAFTSLDNFIERTRQMIAFVKQSRKQPGVEEILMPGEPEYRTMQQRLRDGIPVGDGVWNDIQQLAHELGVDTD